MTNPTRFDLNTAVENWRNELAAQPNLASDDRRELETHLRDAIAGFQQRGLNDEESFWLARRRIGQPQHLSEELVKADPTKAWRERLFWTVLILFLMEIFRNVAIGVTQGLYFDWKSGILVSTFYLLPIFLAVLLCTGKTPRPISSLVRFPGGRFRLFLFVLSSVFISLIIQFHGKIVLDQQAENIFLKAGVHGHFSIPFFVLLPQVILELLPDVVTLLILASLLIWLMPTPNRQTPRRA